MHARLRPALPTLSLPPPTPRPQGFPTGAAFLSAALFHCGLAAICALYLLFWLRLNIMQVGRRRWPGC